MAYTTINKSTDYFNTKLYTGTGAPQSITGVGHQPDLVWIKKRAGSTATSHTLTDVVRGVNKQIFTDDTAAEESYTSVLTSFDSDGFSLSTAGLINASSDTYVAWNWKAGTTSGITTDGNTTITPSSYSFNQTANFSILKFTGNGVEGAKLAHGLGTTPAMVIIKRTSTTGDWVVYHKNLTATKNLFLNYTSAETARSPNGYIYSPDATNITLSNHGDVNNNGVTTVAYCFAEKQGYSKFGSYTGNGNADGTFVYTGFKPAFVMIKRAVGGTDNWVIYDNKRIGFNQSNYNMVANSNSVENTGIPIDILSNGFKARASEGNTNASGNTYIYMAFAEAPLVGDNNVPCTAR